MRFQPNFSKLPLRLFGGIIVLIILAVVIRKGIIEGKPNESKILIQADIAPSEDRAAIPGDLSEVKSLLSQAFEHRVSLKISGITEPAQTLDVEARLSGTVKKIFVQEGDSVKKGTVIATLSVEDRERKLEVAQSLVKLRKMQYQAAKRLAEKDFASPISLANTKNNLSDAHLALSRAELEMSYLKVRAPFSGVVNKMYVEPGTTMSDVSPDRKVCSLINLHPLYITIYVTEKIYEQLKAGNPVKVSVADGRMFEGKIDSISVVADPKTKTFEVSILVPNPQHRVPAGMTAVVEVPLKEKQSHKINPSWITLSKEGIMGVMAVENGIAVFYPITLIHSSPNHFYVVGLPDQLEIITLGQEAIAAGTKVRATLDSQPHEK